MLNSIWNFRKLAGFLLRNGENSVNWATATILVPQIVVSGIVVCGNQIQFWSSNGDYIIEQCLIASLIILAISMEFL